MFKNLKISTGINSLMSIFVFFLASISILMLSGAHRSNDDIKKAVDIATANNAIQSAMSNLNIAVGLVVDESFDETVKFNGGLGHSIDKDLLDNINQYIDSANQDYNKFVKQTELSAENHTQRQLIFKTFDNLMNFTVKVRDILANTEQSLASSDELSKGKNEGRAALKSQVDAYNNLLKTMLNKHTQQVDKKNSDMALISCFMLVISIIMVVFTIWWLKKTLFSRLNRTKETFSILAAGDLSQPIEIGANNEIGQMLAELETMRIALTGTVSEIRLGVTSIHGNARELSSSNQDLSSRTEQQASALQETAASMEELKITVRQNADNAHSAKQLVESASGSARKGGEVMVNLDSIMREITANSRQIADINGVIDSIANQTNILALNAAVEAARAGEQGRGFAVVAGEVRSLAKRSADAAKEIRQLINLAVDNMNTGSQEVELAGAAMDEVVKSVTQVTDIMSEITSASDEQSTGINQIAQAVNEMDSVTQQNASMVEQAANVARSMEESAHALDRAVSQFSLQEGAQSNQAHNTKYADGMTGKKTLASHNAPTLIKSKADDDWVSF